MPSYTRTGLKFSSNKSGGVTNLNLKLGVQMGIRFNSEYLQPSVKLSHGLWLLSASGVQNHHVKTLGKQLIGKALNYQHDTDLADAGNRIKAYLGRKTQCKYVNCHYQVSRSRHSSSDLHVPGQTMEVKYR